MKCIKCKNEFNVLTETEIGDLCINCLSYHKQNSFKDFNINDNKFKSWKSSGNIHPKDANRYFPHIHD